MPMTPDWREKLVTLRAELELLDLDRACVLGWLLDRRISVLRGATGPERPIDTRHLVGDQLEIATWLNTAASAVH